MPKKHLGIMGVERGLKCSASTSITALPQNNPGEKKAAVRFMVYLCQHHPKMHLEITFIAYLES
jgi:hypothetical protein